MCPCSYGNILHIYKHANAINSLLIPTCFFLSFHHNTQTQKLFITKCLSGESVNVPFLTAQSEKLEISDKRPCWGVDGSFIDCMSSLPGDRSQPLIVTNRKLCYWLAVDLFCASQMRCPLLWLSQASELKFRQEAVLRREANALTAQSHILHASVKPSLMTYDPANESGLECL